MTSGIPAAGPGEAMLPIQAVERETGVSKELLRMWERRYGFPAPARDAHGDRLYPPEQVTRLRLLRRLIDGGFRPGKIIRLDATALENLLRSQYLAPTEPAPALEQELLAALKSREPHQVREYLSHQLVKMGLQAFILEFLQYANPLVGDAWMRHQIEVHEEHLYTEQVQALVRGAIGNLRAGTQPPRLMLATPPDESHSLGMLMVEALLRLDCVDAVSFGTHMPVRDLVMAAQKHQMDIVGLSFSASYPASKAVEFLEELRCRLPATIDIWAGGSALRATRRVVAGVACFQDLDSLRREVLAWRNQQRTGRP